MKVDKHDSAIDSFPSHGSSYAKGGAAFAVSGKDNGLVYAARGPGILPRYRQVDNIIVSTQEQRTEREARTADTRQRDSNREIIDSVGGEIT